MASNKDVEESTTETSLDCTAISGPSIRYEIPEFIESCPAVLEPSKDKSRSEDEIFRNPYEIFTSQLPRTPTFVPALMGSASIHSFDLGSRQSSEEYRKKKCCPTCCCAIYNCYSMCAITFRNSRFFYIVQLLLSLLPASALVMGIIYSKACNYTFPVLTSITGIFGLLFVAVWISISVVHHLGRRCSGQQKFLMRMLFGFLTILLTIEITLYFSKTPSFDEDDENYCSKTFIDFTFYKYIALWGSLALATILYIPHFPSFICSFDCSMPIASVSYDQL